MNHVISVFFLLLWGFTHLINAGNVSPPAAGEVRKIIVKHDDVRIDPYFWLREKDNPEVRRYLEAENSYTEQMMKSTENLQNRLYKEMVSRIPATEESVPVLKNGYLYFHRSDKDLQYPVYLRKKSGSTGTAEIILDPNTNASDYDFFDIGKLKVSPDSRILAYSADTDGSETYTVQFKNLLTGEMISDCIRNISGNFEWTEDSRTIYYTVDDESRRPFRVLRYTLGSDTAEIVFEENDPSFYVGVSKSRDGKLILIGSGSSVSSEFHYLCSEKASGRPVLFQKRMKNVEYSIEPHASGFYILTNLKAKNFRIMHADFSSTAVESWKQIIAHDQETRIEGIDAFSDFIAVYERNSGLSRIRIRKLNNSAPDQLIPFPEPSYYLESDENPDYNARSLRYQYSSLITPFSVMEYDVNTGSQNVLKQQEVPHFNKNLYCALRVYATSHDGTKVPVSVVYRKGIPLNGKSPALLYGYGSYGYSMDAYFSQTRLSLLDRGFIYAIAHIRGGEEMGRSWYENGKLMNKKNSFLDFIASAEYLIHNKFTSVQSLIIEGGSAGGLLMGAVTNMRPDLFRGVIADVPFVDAVNTMLDPTLPLTVTEYDEWGNPDDPLAYAYIRSYSPYDNIQSCDYPAMLVTAGLNDPRVGYWEPAKYVAKMRKLRTDSNLLLLKTNMGTGHMGASGRLDYLKEIAFKQAFMMKILGMSVN